MVRTAGSGLSAGFGGVWTPSPPGGLHFRLRSAPSSPVKRRRRQRGPGRAVREVPGVAPGRAFAPSRPERPRPGPVFLMSASCRAPSQLMVKVSASDRLPWDGGGAAGSRRGGGRGLVLQGRAGQSVCLIITPGSETLAHWKTPLRLFLASC